MIEKLPKERELASSPGNVSSAERSSARNVRISLELLVSETALAPQRSLAHSPGDSATRLGSEFFGAAASVSVSVKRISPETARSLPGSVSRSIFKSDWERPRSRKRWSMPAIVTRHWERSTGIEHGNRLGFLAQSRSSPAFLLLLLLFLLRLLLSFSLVRRELLSPSQSTGRHDWHAALFARARDYNFIVLPRELRIPAPRGQASLSLIALPYCPSSWDAVFSYSQELSHSSRNYYYLFFSFCFFRNFSRLLCSRIKLSLASRLHFPPKSGSIKP